MPGAVVDIEARDALQMAPGTGACDVTLGECGEVLRAVKCVHLARVVIIHTHTKRLATHALR